MSAAPKPNPAAPELRTLGQPRPLADVLLDELRQAGVDTVFGIPGGAISPLFNALLESDDLRTICTRHEQGAVFAAAGHARTSGTPGVVLVTSGPGVLNTVTGLASAKTDGVPLVIIAGDSARSSEGKLALQEGSAHHLDIASVCRPLTKRCLSVTQASAAPAALKAALAIAACPPMGPVVVTLPIDVGASVTTPLELASARATTVVEGGLERAVARAASALANARRPTIFVGNGARAAASAVVALADRVGAAVMTTPKAKGLFPESHPQSLGIFGHGGHESAATWLEEGVDVLLVVGTSLRETATNGYSSLVTASDEVIRIDADPERLGHNYVCTLGISGDAAMLLDAITARCPVRRSPRSKPTGRATRSHPALVPQPREGVIPPARALWELQRALPSDTIFTVDIGEHLLFATHYLTIEAPDAFLAMTGLASMGTAIGQAMGAKLAAPHRPVVAICGDGGFAMSATEIATMTQFEIPVVVCVLDDARFGMVEIGHEAVYGRRPRYPTDALSIPDVAAGMGADVRVIDGLGQLMEMDLGARRSKRPLVLDVKIDPSVKMPGNARNASMRRSTFRSGAPKLTSRDDGVPDYA